MVWLLLSAGPLLFLLGIVAASVRLGAAGVAPADIPARVAGGMPQLLLFVQVGLLLLLVSSADARARVLLSLRVPAGRSAGVEIALGVAVGVALAAAYLLWIGPGIVWLQRTVGDYVPPGELLPTLSRSAAVFFAANVLLAPAVEEALYRGYALPLLEARWGTAAAVAATCLFFGLLHWAGGAWYILLTGLVAGGAFAGLFVWRGSLLAPLAAHLALNAVEFLATWRSVRGT